MLLGCIGDDFTGSSDLANTLAKEGMAVELYSGVPGSGASVGIEAGVVALKSRTAPIEEAVAESLRALDWLISQGCEQFFFKYCSTFDSTREGNIGPVAQALAERLAATDVVVCPAFPTTGRTVFQGHLFVGDQLLSETGMARHPLTPMTDPDIRRWLSYQTTMKVGHVGQSVVSGGAESVARVLSSGESSFYVVDAVSDEDLYTIGLACEGRKLVTGGSGVAMGLPGNFSQITDRKNASPWRGASGRGIILSGSCSDATRAQVAIYGAQNPALKVDPRAVVEGKVTAESVLNWCEQHSQTVPLIYASDTPEAVSAAQAEFGKEVVAEAIENLFAAIAAKAFSDGFTRIVAAGGETSGAVVLGLGSRRLQIGPEIAPGVPAMFDPERKIALALKSGNFGDEQFFEKALKILAGGND